LDVCVCLARQMKKAEGCVTCRKGKEIRLISAFKRKERKFTR
jgi:hypothetical protein